jgi:hypothetical protein
MKGVFGEYFGNEGWWWRERREEGVYLRQSKLTESKNHREFGSPD